MQLGGCSTKFCEVLYVLPLFPYLFYLLRLGDGLYPDLVAAVVCSLTFTPSMAAAERMTSVFIASVGRVSKRSMTWFNVSRLCSLSAWSSLVMAFFPFAPLKRT